MQVSVEETGVIERKLTIVVPASEIDEEVEKRISELSKKIRMPGFRPGKTPRSVVKKRYGDSVVSEVSNEKIQSSYQEALAAEKIIPASLIGIEPTSIERGSDLEFVATIEVFPEVPAPDLSGITIKDPVVNVTKADIDRTIDDIRKRNATFEEKTSKAVDTDRLTIDFVGTIEGVEFEGGSAEDFSFVLGAGEMLEDFDSGLSGKKAGDEVVLNFDFPDSYGGEDIAGKPVEFKVTVKKVEKAVLPECNDEFAETMGIKEGGVKKLKEEVEQSLERELSARKRDAVKFSVMQELEQRNQIELPKGLVEEEITRGMESVAERLKSQGREADHLQREDFREEARRRVALGLILRAAMDKYEIRLDEGKVDERLVEMASGYDDTDMFVNFYKNNPEMLNQVQSMVLEEQVIAKVLETATLEEDPQDFQDFMNATS